MNITANDKLPNLAIPSSTSQITEAEQLYQQLHDERQRLQQALFENGLLRHALRTLGNQVQALMPHITSLCDGRDALAGAWATADKVMRDTGK